MDIREFAVQYGKAWVEHDLNAGTASHTEDTIFQIHGDNGEATTGTQAQLPCEKRAHAVPLLPGQDSALIAGPESVEICQVIDRN
jgi:hypothetical protein